MTDSVIIYHDTIVDRGRHDSEGVRVEQCSNTLLTMWISYAGHKEGYIYCANLTAGGISHILRYSDTVTSEPLLSPEVNRLVGAFTSAGWQANTNSHRTQPAGGITQISTEITLTHGTGAQTATAISADFVAAVTAEAQAQLEAERRTKSQAIADSTTCTITQQVIWSIVNDGWKFTAEYITQAFDRAGSDPPILYKLGPMTQSGHQWRAFLSRHNGFQQETIRNDYPLVSKGGNRPTRDDPPAVHLETEMRQLLEQMKTQGWRIEQREEKETSDTYSLCYTITIRLVK